MQTVALSSAPFLAPASAARETWKNGVVHSDDGPADVYELPTRVPGVAQRIEVRPVLWGLLGKEVRVTDCRGRQLEGSRQSDGGWHKLLVARDPDSGLETVLDPRHHTLTVTTPTIRQKTETGPNSYTTRYHREVRQEMDANGKSRLETNLHGESDTMMYSMAREMPANQAMITRDEKSWEETRLAPGQAPVSQRWVGDKYSRTATASLSSSVDAEGRLTVVGEDGVGRSYEMFLWSPTF